MAARFYLEVFFAWLASRDIFWSVSCLP